MTIHPKILAYIDEAVERSVKKAELSFNKRTEHYMDILLEKYRDDLKVVTEFVTTKPNEDRVREIVQEEIRY